MLAERDGLTLQLARETAEVAEDVADGARFRTGLGLDGVAGLFCDDAGEFLGAAFDHIGDAHEEAAAFARWHTAPGREGGRCGLDGGVDVIAGAARHGRDRLAVSGIENGNRLAGATVGPCAVDQHRFMASSHL